MRNSRQRAASDGDLLGLAFANMSSADVPLHEPSEEQIQREAHRLWLERGQPVGQDIDIWLEAKELLKHRHGHAGVDPRLWPEHQHVASGGKSESGSKRGAATRPRS